MISSDNIQSPEKRHHLDDEEVIVDMHDDEIVTSQRHNRSPTTAHHESPARKRSRTVLTPQQTRYLQNMLEKTYFPTAAERDQMSRDIDVPARTVQIWFQNQRQKAKQQIQHKAAVEATQRNSIANMMNMTPAQFQVALSQILHNMGRPSAQAIWEMAQSIFHIGHLSQMTPAMLKHILLIQQHGFPLQKQAENEPEAGQRVPVMSTYRLPPPRLFSPVSRGGGVGETGEELPSLRSLVQAALNGLPDEEHRRVKDVEGANGHDDDDDDGLSVLVSAAVKSEKGSPRMGIVARPPLGIMATRSPATRPLKLKSPEMTRANENFFNAKKSSEIPSAASSTCYLSPETQGLDQHSAAHHEMPMLSPEDMRAVYSEPCSPGLSPGPEEIHRATTPYGPTPHRKGHHHKTILLAPL